MTCIGTWRDFICTWPSCGGAQCRGVPSGRACLRTAWTTFAELKMTVTRQVWSDSLSAQHSGISTDVLLFSDIHLSLVHNYRIHKRGLPHIAFWRNYLSQLHALLPFLQPTAGLVSPDSSGSGSLRPGDSPEVMIGTPRTTRRAHRQRRPVRVEEPASGGVGRYGCTSPRT